MDTIDSTMRQFNSTVNNILSPVLDHKIGRPLVMLGLVMYGGLAAPSFAQKYRWLFDNIYFRMTLLFLIMFTSNKDPALSIMIAVSFITVMNLIGGKKPFERFEGPQTAVYPGCMNITVFDLLESFQNDKEKLLDAMLRSKVPGDVKVTDYYAPLIATYLMNHEYVLKSPCSPPGADQGVGY